MLVIPAPLKLSLYILPYICNQIHHKLIRMSTLNIKFIMFAFAFSFFLSNQYVIADDGCIGSIPKLAFLCQRFVLKNGPQIDPSAQCCEVIKNADIPCICSHIPKGLENVYSMEKVVYVAKFCGRPLTPGSKCGGKIGSFPYSTDYSNLYIFAIHQFGLTFYICMGLTYSFLFFQIIQFQTSLEVCGRYRAGRNNMFCYNEYFRYECTDDDLDDQ